MPDYLQAGKFKSKYLKVMDEMRRTKKRITITKRNVPVVAQIMPIDPASTSLFGNLKGIIHILSNIIHPTDEMWDANY